MDVERTAFVLDRLGRPPEGKGFLAPDGLNAGETASEEIAPAESGVKEAGAGTALITVKVWNASGRVGLAIQVVRRLRAAGVDVVEWGNYNGRQNKSRVIDRSGQFERARTVAALLNVVSIYSDVDPGLRTDVDVVLGEDFGTTEKRQGDPPWK
jgi:hypothetical protein